MYKVDIRTNMPNNKLSLVFFVNKCNMKCVYCNYIKMLSFIKKEVSYNETDDIIKYHKDFINSITVSGGEPLLDIELIQLLYNKCLEYNLDFYIYTNLLEIESIQWLIDIINENKTNISIKLYVDVKGTDVESIMNNTNLDSYKSNKLISLYNKYCNNNNIIWRINENIIKNDLYNKLKNKEFYYIR